MFWRTTVALGLLSLLLATPQVSLAYDVSSFFDVFVENSTGGPYPAGTSVGIHVQNGSPLTTTADASINLYDAYSGGISSNKTAAALSATATSVAASSTTMALTTNATIDASSFFDVFCDISPKNGGSLSDVRLDYSNLSSFFDVFVEYADPSQGLGVIQQLNFHGSLSDGLTFSSLSLEAVNYADGTFHLQSAINGAVAANQPVMEMELTGSVVPEPSSIILTALGAISLLFWVWRRGWSR